MIFTVILQCRLVLHTSLDQSRKLVEKSSVPQCILVVILYSNAIMQMYSTVVFSKIHD